MMGGPRVGPRQCGIVGFDAIYLRTCRLQPDLTIFQPGAGDQTAQEPPGCNSFPCLKAGAVDHGFPSIMAISRAGSYVSPIAKSLPKAAL
jgi:hypothetical protein